MVEKTGELSFVISYFLDTVDSFLIAGGSLLILFIVFLSAAGGGSPSPFFSFLFS